MKKYEEILTWLKLLNQGIIFLQKCIVVKVRKKYGINYGKIG